MKDFYFWTLFAAFYLVMVNLFPVTIGMEQGPPGIQPEVINPSNLSPDQANFRPPQAPASRPSVPAGSRTNTTGFNWDQFGINDPAIRQNLVDLYGTLLGQPDCVKKSMCVLGNTFHDLPGRDALFTFLGRYVPDTWGVLYDIFRVSIMYGQNCKVYICDYANLPEPSMDNLFRPLGGANSMWWQSLFGFPTSSPASGTGTVPGTSTTTATPTPRPAQVDVDNEVHKDPAPENLQRL